MNMEDLEFFGLILVVILGIFIQALICGYTIYGVLYLITSKTIHLKFWQVVIVGLVSEGFMLLASHSKNKKEG